MSEEKEDQKTKKLGIIALATEDMSLDEFGCFFLSWPFPQSLPFLAERLRWARWPSFYLFSKFPHILWSIP